MPGLIAGQADRLRETLGKDPQLAAFLHEGFDDLDLGDDPGETPAGGVDLLVLLTLKDLPAPGGQRREPQVIGKTMASSSASGQADSAEIVRIATV